MRGLHPIASGSRVSIRGRELNERGHKIVQVAPSRSRHASGLARAPQRRYAIAMSETPECDACDPAALAELVKRGDVAALDRMTRCYGDRLLRAGRRHCRTAEEAEDAVQDTLLKTGRAHV